MIKPVNRQTKKAADLEAVVSEWREDYGVDFGVAFVPANVNHGELESFVATLEGSTEGVFEFCYGCETAWICFGGDIHDEDHCIYCGEERE